MLAIISTLMILAAYAELPNRRSVAAPLADREPITPIPPPPAADPRKVALGAMLFEDRRLSRDKSIACVSCHDTRGNGADSYQHSVGSGGGELSLNTPTVFNAGLNFRLNWEGNYRSLEAHAAATLENPAIMGANIDEVVGKLSADAEVSQRFREAYGHPPDRTSLLDALAIHGRSLVTPGSPFDRWLEGDATALTVEERNGYLLFNSLGCISCHQGVNAGGNLFERHGIFRPLASPNPAIVRVPSLRNVATTAPYFHDGSAPTLNDAVRRMAASQLDQSLTDHQVDLIVTFLKTLTGTYRGVPVVAPP